MINAAETFRTNKANIQLFLTRRCQLRCTYCPVDKSDKDMNPDIVRRAVDLLMTHRNTQVRLDFSGGDPLLRWDLLEEALGYAEKRARIRGKRLSFYLVTNAVAMSPRVLDELLRHDLALNISLDGGHRTNNSHRLPLHPGLNAYQAARRGLGMALSSGIDLSVVQVVTPESAGNLFENFTHLLDLGVRSVDINYAIGSLWEERKEALLFEQLDRIIQVYGEKLSRRELSLGNLNGRVEPAALNTELMVDTDGSLHILSEWLFQTTPPDGESPLDYGDVFQTLDINGLYWGPFHAYAVLKHLYRGNVGVKRILLNNIQLGKRVGKYFHDLKARRFNGNLCLSG